MFKTRTWIIFIAIMFILFSTLSIILGTRNSGNIANVYENGNCIYSVDLSAVTASFEKELVLADGSHNTLLIEHGRIRMIAADCPDLVCVNTGWIKNSSAPIVCLPHRLVVRIEKQEKDIFDSVVR